MSLALRNSDVAPDEIDWIVAHGTSTPLSQGTHVTRPAALLSAVLFGVIAWGVIDAFDNQMIDPFEPTPTSELADVIFTRLIIPFEVVSIVLLAALIGGIALARRDDEEQAR